MSIPNKRVALAKIWLNIECQSCYSISNFALLTDGVHHRLPNDWIPYADSVESCTIWQGTPRTNSSLKRIRLKQQQAWRPKGYPKEKKIADAEKRMRIFDKHVKFDKAIEKPSNAVQGDKGRRFIIW